MGTLWFYMVLDILFLFVEVLTNTISTVRFGYEIDNVICCAVDGLMSAHIRAKLACVAALFRKGRGIPNPSRLSEVGYSCIWSSLTS